MVDDGEVNGLPSSVGVIDSGKGRVPVAQDELEGVSGLMPVAGLAERIRLVGEAGLFEGRG